MAKRRATRNTNNSVSSEFPEIDANVNNEVKNENPNTTDNILNIAINNVISSSNNDEKDGEYKSDNDIEIPDQDDGEDYTPDNDINENVDDGFIAAVAEEEGEEGGEGKRVKGNNSKTTENNNKLKKEVDAEQPQEHEKNNEEEEENGEDGEYKETEDDEENGSETKSQKRKAPQLQRRQKHSNLNAVNRKRQQLTPVGMEEESDENSLPVENDEYVTPNDVKGDKKITKLGVLLGGREFRVKTFKVPGRGDIMYTVSTDVARLVGYRDSYFLFQKHTNLYRVRIDEDAKMSLINDDYLPATFKTRAAYLITARSAFKEFGARIIVDGRQIIDDYYEDQARKDGAIEGAIINPILSNDGYNNSVTDNQTLFEKQRNIALLLANNNILETETSWVYDHALKCRQFDSMLFYDRNELLKKHVQRDIYTNLNFVPDITQPTRCTVKKISSNVNDTKRKIIFDTVIGGSSVVNTGLSDVPLEIFDGCVSEEVKNAILEQQKLEKYL